MDGRGTKFIFFRSWTAGITLAAWLLTGCSGTPEQEGKEEDPAVEKGDLSRSAMLYFTTPDGRELSGEKREIFPADPSREAYTRSLLHALAVGPAREGLYPVVPPALEAEGVFFDDMGGLFISLNGASLRGWAWGSSSEMAFLRGILRTLGGSFPEVGQVSLLVDGERVESIAGHIEAYYPFEVAQWR